MKRLLILVFVSISFGRTFSQEKSILSVTYDCLYRTNVEDVEPLQASFTLNRGENTSVFYRKPEIVRGMLFDFEKTYRVYKNIPKKDKLTYREGFIDLYYYTEPIADFKWEMLDGDTTICGYSCQRAVTHFRGRTWYVWYAMDLPYNDGPWKLCGLPGLIMKAEDAKGDYSFSAYKIEKGGDGISLDLKGCKEIKPEDLQKEIREHKANPFPDEMKKIFVDVPKELIPEPKTACFMEYFGKE